MRSQVDLNLEETRPAHETSQLADIDHAQPRSTQDVRILVDSSNGRSAEVPLTGEPSSDSQASEERHAASCFPGREGTLACIGRAPSNRRQAEERSVAINIERSIIDPQRTSNVPFTESTSSRSLYELQIVRAMWPARNVFGGSTEEPENTCEGRECCICLEDLQCESSVVTG